MFDPACLRIAGAIGRGARGVFRGVGWVSIGGCGEVAVGVGGVVGVLICEKLNFVTKSYRTVGYA